MPSCPSFETRCAAMVFAVIGIASSRVAAQTLGTSAFAAAIASGPAVTISRTYSPTFASSPAAETTA